MAVSQFRHRVNEMPFRIRCMQRGWRRSTEIAEGLNVSPAMVGRALRGEPVGERFIATCTAAFGRDSYPEMFYVEES